MYADTLREFQLKIQLVCQEKQIVFSVFDYHYLDITITLLV